MKRQLTTAALAALVMMSGCSGEVSYEEIDSTTAVVMCKSAIENRAKFDSDVSIFDATTLSRQDNWLVKLPAKLQNGFGAWRNVTAYCRVKKKNPDPKIEFNPAAVIEFEVIPR